MKGVAVLGSTGSIGTSALRVLERHSDRFRVVALTAYQNAEAVCQQIKRFHPLFAGIVSDGVAVPEVGTCELGAGKECLIQAATHPEVDIVVNAVVGAAGLAATLAALEAGKRVALANKESLVLGGDLVMDASRRGGGEIIPVDSEHSAILQCIGSTPQSEINRVVITASGGPFRGYTLDSLEKVTVHDALQHPTWTMGKKITIDSATLANKALEVIEAHYLFELSYDQIDVVVHPQSLIHSFVEFVDNSVLAQIGVPSMELPILYALTYPERVSDSGGRAFNPVEQGSMTFEDVSLETFSALRLGIQAGRAGGAAPAIFNAANEAAVARFLAEEISFLEISMCIEEALSKFAHLPSATLEERLLADREARSFVGNLFHNSSRPGIFQ